MRKLLFLGALSVFLFGFHNLFALKFQMKIGDVSIERSGKKIPVKVESDVKDRDTICTGEKSLLIVQFPNGDSVKIKEKTRVVISSVSGNENTGITVLRGFIEAKYNKIKREGPAKVYTATTVAAVRGTEFEVAVAASGDTRVSMSEGKLNVSNPSGEILIGGSQKSETEPGSVPEISADSSAVEKWMQTKDDELEANPAKYADGYKKQVGRMQDRTVQSRSKMKSVKSDISKAGTANQMPDQGESIDKAAAEAEDDYNINAAAASAIEGITEGIKQTNIKMYKEFTLLKKEMNKVAEQKKRDMEEIAKIKKLYLKFKQEIIEGHKKNVEDIVNATK